MNIANIIIKIVNFGKSDSIKEVSFEATKNETSAITGRHSSVKSARTMDSPLFIAIAGFGLLRFDNIEKAVTDVL